MDRFILIDGNAILHRAYHALPPLTSPTGEVVNAVYGFFSMFLRIVEDLKPSYIVVCFDRPKPTFRQALYVGYQATRPKMASDLSPQIGLLHDALETMGVQIYELDGYEADDCIGTIAKQTQNSKLKTKNIETIIVSGDRDLLQLVNSHVKMLAPLVGLTNTIMYDGDAVEKKFGVKPAQIIDYKALVGDASDNYPGVGGIGPKTASELLRKYGTFENLYEHLGELPPKISEKLAQDAEQAALAKKLATIDCDSPITLDIEKCSLSNFDIKKAKKVFEKFGFNSLLKRFGAKVEPAVAVAIEKAKNEQLGLL